MAKFTYDAQFIDFCANLEQAIARFEEKPTSEKEFTALQKKQVEALVKAERFFKKTLQQDARGLKAYKAFIAFITEDRRNILAARPYFRERQAIFSKGISPAIRSQNPKKLYKYNINYTFIELILRTIPFAPNSRVVRAAKEVKRIRQELITKNIPLAISRARIFRQKTPESHLTFMDLNQISFEGLINAVDKFVLPYSKVFRSVIIGRVTGDQIAGLSESLIHFWPDDKRKIYRANKANRGKKEINFEETAASVNSGPELKHATDASEIQHLMAANSHSSLDAPIGESVGNDEEDQDTFGDRFPAAEGTQPDVLVEENDLYQSLYEAIGQLEVIEQKLIKMKGMNN